MVGAEDAGRAVRLAVELHWETVLDALWESSG